MLDTEKYTFVDGKTALSAAELNVRFWALVRRLHALESLSVDWAAAVAEVQNHGLARINEAFLPLLDSLKSDLDALVAQGSADLAGYAAEVKALIDRGDAAVAETAAGAAAVMAQIEATLVGLQAAIATLCPLDDAGLVPAERIPANAGIPSGVIVMWSGAADAVPAGWALCDGAGGTPDLRGRFVVGAGDAYDVGSEGGEESHDHTASTGATTLTIAQMPSHNHVLAPGASLGYNAAGYVVGSGVHNILNFYPSFGTDSRGGGGSHNHTATVAGSSNMPPYYALCYIMKI